MHIVPVLNRPGAPQGQGQDVTLGLSMVYRYGRMKMVPHPLFSLLQGLHMLFTLAEMFFSSSTSKFLPVLRNTRVRVSSFIKTSLFPEAKSSLTPPTPLALAPLSPRCSHWSWDYLYLPLDWDWEYPGERAHLTHSGTLAPPELRVWHKVGLSGWMCWVGWSPRSFQPAGPLRPRKVTNDSDFPSVWDTELKAKGSCSPESDAH